MKKLFISLFIILLVLLTVVWVSIKNIDLENVYEDFAKASQIDVDHIKDSEIKIKKFPYPYVWIDKVSKDGKINLENIYIKFSLSSLIKMNPKVTNIDVDRAFVKLEQTKVGLLSHDRLAKELIKSGSFFITANIKKLSFIDNEGEEVTNIKNVIYKGEENISEFFGGSNSGLSFHAKFEKKEEIVHLNMDISDNDFSINITEIYNKENKMESGKLKIKAVDLISRFADLVPELASVDKNFSSAEEVMITSDLKIEENFFSLSNILIESGSIKGKGDLRISQNDLDKSNIKFDFENIDLVKFFSKQANNENSKKRVYATGNQFRFNENPMKINIFAKNVVAKEGVSLKDFNIKLDVKDDKLNIKDFSADISNGGKFELEGVVTQNSFRSLFYGKIKLAHTDLNDLVVALADDTYKSTKPIPFALVSDLKFSSVDVSLDNLAINTSDNAISGNFSSKFIGNSPRTNANIRIAKVDLDKGDLPIVTGYYSYLQNLLVGMKDANYIKKFIPIRKISTLGNYNITFDRVIAGSRTYEGVNFGLSLAPGKVAIDQLYIENGDDWIDTSISLEAKAIRPVLTIDIHNGSVKADFLSAPTLLNLRNKIYNNYDLNKVDINMNFALNHVYSDLVRLKKLRFNAKKEKGVLNVSKLNFGVFEGALKSSGSILLEPYTINFVYALNSARFEEIAKLLPSGYLKNEGVISINGNLNTNGNSIEEQLYNLYVQSDFIVKDVFIRKFSIDSLIKDVRDEDYDLDLIDEDLNKALLTGVTRVRELKGSAELIKGKISAPQVTMKTDYSAALVAAVYNLYDFNFNTNTDFSFFLSRFKSRGRQYGNKPVKINVKASGNIFNPKKEANIEDLKQRIILRYREANR